MFPNKVICKKAVSKNGVRRVVSLSEKLFAWQTLDMATLQEMISLGNMLVNYIDLT